MDCVKFLDVRDTTGTSEIHGHHPGHRIILIVSHNHNWFEQAAFVLYTAGMSMSIREYHIHIQLQMHTRIQNHIRVG